MKFISTVNKNCLQRSKCPTIYNNTLLQLHGGRRWNPTWSLITLTVWPPRFTIEEPLFYKDLPRKRWNLSELQSPQCHCSIFSRSLVQPMERTFRLEVSLHISNTWQKSKKNKVSNIVWNGNVGSQYLQLLVSVVVSQKLSYLGDNLRNLF